MGTLIDRKREEIEQRRIDARKIELYNKLWRHLKAIVYILAELQLGYKPDLD